MPISLTVNSNVHIPETEIEITTSRSGGPGGQHVNKTSTRVTLRWNVAQSFALDEDQRARIMLRLASRLTKDGDLILHVDTSRSQFRNRELALERLIELVKGALTVNKKRVATKPSRGAKTRRIQNKKRIGLVKKQRQHGFGDNGDS